MRSSPSRDEREAYLLADVASAHDAGLPLSHILQGPAMGSFGLATAGGEKLGATDLTMAEGLRSKGVELAAHEMLMLETAERSGSLSRALRNLAKQRTQRGTRNRDLRRRMVYPAFLIALGFAVSILTAQIGGSLWPPILVIAILIASVYGAITLVLRSIHRDDGPRVPLIRSLVLDLGEVPYLQSFHGLYTAGVKIQEAHDLALKTVPIEGVRVRLFEAGQVLGKGTSLAEALHAASALHPETRQMLSAAEASGDLEGSLERAIERRQSALDRETKLLTKIGIAVIMVLVYGYTAFVVISFYTTYFNTLLNR